MPRTSRRFIVLLGIAVLSTLPSALPLRAQAGGPVSKGQVSEEQILQLIAYIKSLGSKP